MAAECAVPVADGACGVLAVGRCRLCSAPFCDSHRGQIDTIGSRRWSDRCITCTDDFHAQQREDYRQNDAGFFSEAPALLAAAGLPRVDLVEDRMDIKRVLGFRREVHEWVKVAEGYLIGEHMWDLFDAGSRQLLTAVVVIDDILNPPLIGYHPAREVVPVWRPSGCPGYAASGGGDRLEDPRAVVRHVRQLLAQQGH